MAKTESKATNKTTKKGKRRLKRSVRKTLGTLFLVSAIVVAAIPVDGLQAWTGGSTATGATPTKVWVPDGAEDENTGENGTDYIIPTIEAGTEVFYSEDGAFKFALMGLGNGNNTPSGLMVLDYDSSRDLSAIIGGVLTIPSTFDVYHSYGDGDGRCAYGSKGDLYYHLHEQYYKLTPGPGGTDYREYGYVVISPDGTGEVMKTKPDSNAPGDVLDNQWVIYSRYNNLEEFEYTQKAVSGNDNIKTKYSVMAYEVDNVYPCLAGVDAWKNLEWTYDADNKPIKEGLYYLKDGATGSAFTDYEEASTRKGVYRYTDVPLFYIGNQEIEYNTTNKRWEVSENYITSGEKGVFSSKKLDNVGSTASTGTVRFGENLVGIGDYAFSGSGIGTVEFNNPGMSVVGDHAFEGCKSLTQVKFSDQGLKVIGAHAFEGCTALTAFIVPSSVEAIGDSAFSKCTELKEIDLGGQLERLGYFAFEECRSLKSLTFPSGFDEEVPISTIKGCVKLEWVKYLRESNTQKFTFVDKNADGNVHEANTYANYSLEKFRNDLITNSATEGYTDFYFEGYQGDNASLTPLHQMARDNLFAFKYLGRNRYEITTTSYNEGNTTTKYAATYQAEYVDGKSDELVYVSIAEGMENVTIPGMIGPCRVTSIGSDSFQNNCNVKSVTIPSTITNIASEAFKGCHDLRTVTFEYKKDNPNRAMEIGTDAFATQNTSCSHTPVKTPYLFFEGPISPSFKAFEYAMDPHNNIDFGTQNGPVYITYFSGWPSNLVVRYNANTEKQELIAYPTVYNVKADDTGLDNNDGTPIKWTNLNYIKWGDGYKNIFGDGFYGAITTYLNDGSATDNERKLIDAILNITLPEGIESVAWFDNPKTGSVSGGDHNSSSAMGVEPAKKVSLFTLNSAKEVAMLNNLFGSKTITTNGMEIKDRTFEDCDTLKTAYIQGNTASMGDYAFMGCSNLATVEIPDAMSSMGKRPFTGCEKLSNISCPSSPYFTCIDSIIYGLTNGSPTKVIECLEGKSNGSVTVESTATEMEAEAFAETEVVEVDLRNTAIKSIPESAFQYTKDLYSVWLPHVLATIGDNAFADSNIKILKYQGSSLGIVSPYAFADTVDGKNNEYKGKTDISKLTFYCPKGSSAEIVLQVFKNNGLTLDDIDEMVSYTVQFYNEDGSVLLYEADNVEVGSSVEVDKLIQAGTIKVEQKPGKKISWNPQNFNPVKSGESNPVKTYLRYDDDDSNLHTVTFYADRNMTTELKVYKDISTWETVVQPAPTQFINDEGKYFSGWGCIGGKYNINDLAGTAVGLEENVGFYPIYSEDESGGFWVTFQDWDGTTLYAKMVQAGESATYPGTPRRDGYIFSKWSGDTSNITANTTVFAIYELDPSSGGNGSSGDGSGGNGSSGDGSGGNVSGGNSPSNANATYYTLTVRNGSGSGSYIAGEQAIIVANDPAAGMEFSNWTIEPTDTKIASTGISATVITMPEKNVTVVANYKTKSSTNNGGGTTGSSNSSNKPGTTGTVNKGGTTVIINKNGLSNTGVVSATVNGSSDNFTIKISESGTASEAVVKALMAEYNNDLSNIKYFPMDISLYDSTGQKKITDTTGLKITITLPLPDSLSVYAGNNKVAGVVNDRLDKLTPQFNTISGVPCVTFTVEHFSPYVIYVDTTNLSANGMADSTPKTGDGIHPKWFLSLGLGCLSIVFFMKKDKKKEKKPVKVRA